MDRRKHPRFDLQFPVSFSGSGVNGTGFALNISEEGCLIASDQCPKDGHYLEICLNLPDREAPLKIDSAAVRWVSGRTFGLHFLYMATATHDRLHEFIANLRSGQVVAETPAPAVDLGRGADRRSEPRFAVRFRSSFSSKKMLGGEGTVTELSSRGCRVCAEAPVPAKTILEMHLNVEDDEAPIKIPEAVVRWSEGNEFGLEFRDIDPKSFDRMRKVIQKLAST